MTRNDAGLTVIIVDDDDLLRGALSALVAQMPGIEVVATAVDGVDGIDKARTHRPSVVLMDVAMPRMDGVEATRVITAELPGTHVVALTSLTEGATGVRMIRAGAVGYLTKALRPDVLESTIRWAASGRGVVDGDVARSMTRHQPTAHPDAPALTDEELKVLTHLVQGLSNVEIAAAVHSSPGTIKKRVAALQEKLNANNRTATATRALTLGLVDIPPVT